MIRMPDIIYLISESYMSYTRLYLLIQDGRHNSKWPPAESKIKISYYWISYLSYLSGLIKVFGPRNTMPNIIILSNEFLEVFEVFLISIV